MKQLVAVLLLALLLVSCSNPEQNYQHQRAAAAQLPPAPQLGLRLPLGAPRKRVAQVLDSLRRRKELQVRVLTERDTFRTFMEPTPIFKADKLVGLQIRLSDGLLTKPLVVGVLDSLRELYGSHQGRQFTGGYCWYWFSGSTEIDYGYSATNGGWRIAYSVLPPRLRPLRSPRAAF